MLPVGSVPFALFFGTLNGATVDVYLLTYRLSLVFGAVIGCTNILLGHWSAWQWPARWVPQRMRWAAGWSVYILANVLAALLAAWIVNATLLPGFTAGGRSWLLTGMFAVVFTLLIGGFILALDFRRESAERAAAIERVRRELAQAELRALRAQIHPHFLFNTLNTIAALIAENPRAAEDVVTRLADVFRYALRATERESSPLAEELAFVHAYLEVERARFGTRLRLEEHVEPGLDALPVPSLLLQPLIENAVRYAVSTRPGGGTLRLSARREADTLVLEVGDDGPGMGAAPSPNGHGIGLESVRERLRLLGSGAGLAIDSTPGRGTRVRLTLPLPAGLA